MAIAEETPLLTGTYIHTSHTQVYDRFTSGEKRLILTLVSCCALIPAFIHGALIPSIPQVSYDLSTTPEVTSLTISTSHIGTALGSMFMATYSRYYGRRPIYLVGLPFFCLGSYQMAKARSIYQFVAWNFVQNVGISGGISLGAGTIGDIFKLEDRGFAMGLFYGASLLGLAIAPVIGGFATHYTSWRTIHWASFIYGLIVLILIALRLPETSHPGTLGVEKADNQEQHAQADGVSRQRQKRRWVWLNPFSCLGLLRSPNLMLVALADTSVLLMDFVLSVPLRNTIGAKYGITNEALIGAILIPCGVGNTVGALLAGYISDRIIITYRAKRGGEWYPEDRLRGTLFSAATLVPLAVLFTGLTVEYVPGRTGLLLCLVWLFMNGVGIRLVLSPSEAYNVDVVHARSSEIIAASTATRTLLVSILVPGILPSIDHFGIVVTNMAAALIVWAGLGLLMVTIRYGKQLRSWMDVGFSTVEDN